jgi:hypothetical protein
LFLGFSFLILSEIRFKHLHKDTSTISNVLSLSGLGKGQSLLEVVKSSSALVDLLDLRKG